MSFTINSHEKTNRVQVINIKSEDLDRLIFPFQKHTITSLEYKPFSRFTLTKSLDEVFENKLGKTLVKILKSPIVTNSPEAFHFPVFFRKFFAVQMDVNTRYFNRLVNAIVRCLTIFASN